MEKTILIAGGDLRQIHLANLLIKNYIVYVIGFNSYIEFDKAVNVVTRADKLAPNYLILPMPVSSDKEHISAPLWDNRIKLSSLLNDIKKPDLVLGGKIDKYHSDILKNRFIEHIDILNREELAVQNAVPTAEGALQIIMEELPTTIYGQKCLITGFGRISKVLIKYLTALGADLYVTARKYSDLAWIRIYGAKAIHISELKNGIYDYSFIINTVPVMLFTESMLKSLNKNCLVIDLASKPGGVDFETAKNLGIKVIWALSLPGKTAPISSGEIIYDTIKNILTERGEIFD